MGDNAPNTLLDEHHFGAAAVLYIRLQLRPKTVTRTLVDLIGNDKIESSCIISHTKYSKNFIGCNANDEITYLFAKKHIVTEAKGNDEKRKGNREQRERPQNISEHNKVYAKFRKLSEKQKQVHPGKKYCYRANADMN